MEKMLVISQNENDTWFVSGLSIGRREPRIVVGTKIKELLKELGVTEEGFVSIFEPNYRENIKRILNNEEIPKEKVFDKILRYFQVNSKECTKNFFYDSEFENVIVNDARMIMAEYPTNERAKEVKKLTDDVIVDCVLHEKPIVIRLPKE